ncbi:MAG: hypothetical protein Kapaf2KO_07130 [Candidatus Kapaibacteriales bacterium]
MNITNILRSEAVGFKESFDSKEEALQRLVSLAAANGGVSDQALALSAVKEREEMMSTGIGGGIALPHAKTDTVKEPTGSLLILSEPLEFDAVDGEPVFCIFLLLGRDSRVGLHLRILSKVSRLLSSTEFKSQMVTAQSKEELMGLFQKFDNMTTI